jgi:hypothetical protein
MSDRIEEKRDEIVGETNTAQQEFLAALDALHKDHANEIRFDTPMHGDLDFSELTDRGFKRITHIIFDEAGEITNIRNLPEGLTHLDCKNQMLIDVESLPSTLESLDLAGNYVTKLDLTETAQLKTLNASDNELESVMNLPATLETLELENNQLKRLDLSTATSLRILRCSNNPLLVVENPPASLVEFDMENNPLTEIDIDGGVTDKKDGAKSRVEYLDAMNEYFRLKGAYEQKLRQLKKNAYERGKSKREALNNARKVKPPCIQCARKVGTTFSRKNGRYMATCGDVSKPCALNIQIFSGYYFDNETLLGIYREDLDKTKESVIKQKMDTLFNYVSDTESVKKFKEELEKYNEDSKMYKDLLKRYKDLYENEEWTLVMKKKTEEMYAIIEDMKRLLEEYKKTQNPEVLKSALRTHKEDLMPVVANIRLHKYGVMEMVKPSENESELVQHALSLNKMDFKFGEDARVIKFVV